MKILHRHLILIALLLTVFLFNQCKKETRESAMEPIDEVAEIAPPMDDEIYVIDEHMIGEIPIVKKNSNTPVKTEESAPETATQPETETPEVYSPEEFDVVLVEYDYEPVEEEVTVTEAYIPLDETQTLIAYNKKDKQEAVLQVVSDENGEIEYIAFSDKHHKDIYDVQAGMTAKEAKMLRKELKHMKHKGNHYLYDDQSNIMYLLDVQDSEGNEVISEEIDQYEISAIVWKDKKHHKTN